MGFAFFLYTVACLGSVGGSLSWQLSCEQHPNEGNTNLSKPSNGEQQRNQGTPTPQNRTPTLTEEAMCIYIHTENPTPFQHWLCYLVGSQNIFKKMTQRRAHQGLQRNAFFFTSYWCSAVFDYVAVFAIPVFFFKKKKCCALLWVLLTEEGKINIWTKSMHSEPPRVTLRIFLPCLCKHQILRKRKGEEAKTLIAEEGGRLEWLHNCAHLARTDWSWAFQSLFHTHPCLGSLSLEGGRRRGTLFTSRAWNLISA